jgi:hypothetical protein
MRSPLAQALLNPLNLAMLALAVAAGLCAAWWLLPLGLLLWVIMVVVVWGDPTLRLTQELQTRPAVAYRFQAQCERLQKVQVALHNQLATTGNGARRILQPVEEQVGQVVDHAYDLCMRMAALDNNRKVATMNRNLTEELALIDLKIAQAEDEQVRQRYTESRKALQDRIDELNQTGSLLDQFDGQLLTLATTMESLQGDVVRLLAGRKKDIQADIGALLRTLQEQNEQLNSFEAQVIQLQRR